jgi:hypothetical protein
VVFKIPHFAFQQRSRGESWEEKLKKGTYLIEVDVGNPLLVVIITKKEVKSCNS